MATKLTLTFLLLPMMQVASCLVAAALAVPVPQQLQYVIRRPDGSVSLHSQALDFQNLQTNQQFSVQLGNNQPSRVNHQQQGAQLASTGATAQFNIGGTAQFNRGATPQFNAGATSHFNVQLDDSVESNELLVSVCPSGQLRHGNKCVVPRINRNIFVFGKDDPPEQKSVNVDAIPLPQLDYNIIFVRSKPAKTRKQIIIPPPQKKTVVYVLEDEVESLEDFVEVPSHPEADPEVYYVKVRPGENPQLPGGIDLQTAYSQAIQPLQGDQEIDFDSSIELTLGAGAGAVPGVGAGAVGVPLPDAAGVSGFGGVAGSSGSARPDGALGFDGTVESSGTSGFDRGASFDGATGFDGAAGFGAGAAGFGAGDAGFGAGSAGFSGAEGSAGAAGFSEAGFNAGSTFHSTGTEVSNAHTVGIGMPHSNANVDFGATNTGVFSAGSSFGVPLPPFSGNTGNTGITGADSTFGVALPQSNVNVAGAGGSSGSFGVALPQLHGNAEGSGVSGTGSGFGVPPPSFNSNIANTGGSNAFNNFGVPLPPFNGNVAAIGIPGVSGGAGGAQSAFNANANAGFSASSSSVGVPLPPFNNNGAFSSNAGFNSGTSGSAQTGGQTFPVGSPANAVGSNQFQIELDNQSVEAVQAAIRYQLPHV